LTYSGKRYFIYFITYIDDFSIYFYIYLTYSKSELFYKFKFFKAEVENQLERKIKKLWSGRVGEYSSNEMNYILKLYGIIHQITPFYSP